MSTFTIGVLGNAGVTNVTADDSANNATLALRTGSGDVAMRQAILSAIAGGSNNAGFTKGGVYSFTGSITIDLNTVNGTFFPGDCTSGAATCNIIGAASEKGLFLVVTKSDSSANTLTVDPNSTETAAGQTSIVLRRQYESVCLYSDGTNLQVVAYFAGSTFGGSIRTQITDPGASEAIPVTSSGFVEIVTAGPETRTIAAPTVVGQELLIIFKTKVGNCVITVASTVNSGGNNTVSMTAAGQSILLIGICSGSSLIWMNANNGTILTTV